MSDRIRPLAWPTVIVVGLGLVLVEQVGGAATGAALDVPAWAAQVGALTITTAFAVGLATRLGGRAVTSGLLAFVLVTFALLSQQPVLIAGVAVGTAVLAGVLAVLATTARVGYLAVVGECVVATGVAVTGGLAVVAYDASISAVRAGYVALGLSLLCALALVDRLGSGVHRSGARGAARLMVGVLFLLVGVVYAEALTRWGSPALVTRIDVISDAFAETFGAVPRPLEVLVGFPALAWGVWLRSRSAAGWQVTAFGAPSLASVAVSLLEPGPPPAEFALSLLYSAILGLALGYLVIRIDRLRRGSGKRSLERGPAALPEPGRMRALG